VSINAVNATKSTTNLEPVLATSIPLSRRRRRLAEIDGNRALVVHAVAQLEAELVACSNGDSLTSRIWVDIAGRSGGRNVVERRIVLWLADSGGRSLAASDKDVEYVCKRN